jgi:hypothetical protein
MPSPVILSAAQNPCIPLALSKQRSAISKPERSGVVTLNADRLSEMLHGEATPCVKFLKSQIRGCFAALISKVVGDVKQNRF